MEDIDFGLRTRQRLLALVDAHCEAEAITHRQLSRRVFGTDEAVINDLRRGSITLRRIERLEEYLWQANLARYFDPEDAQAA